MIFWIFMLLTSLLLPIIMIGFGRYFMNNPPKEINMVWGYRTTLSMKNMDTWVFAHKYFGGLWNKFGVAMLVLSIIPMIFVINKSTDTIGVASIVILLVQFIVLFWTIYLTEKALRNNFDDCGNKK